MPRVKPKQIGQKGVVAVLRGLDEWPLSDQIARNPWRLRFKPAIRLFQHSLCWNLMDFFQCHWGRHGRMRQPLFNAIRRLN